MDILSKSTIKPDSVIKRIGLVGPMFRRIRLNLLLLLLSGMILTVNPGCITSSLRKQQRQVERTQEKSAREDEKLYKKAIKQHQKKQSDNTRKMMKQTRKKARNFNKNLDRRFFLWKWMNI